MRRLILAALAALIAGPALAGPVTLRPQPVDADGQVTFGDLFENAGPAAGMVVAARTGPSVVIPAGQLQGLALRAGLEWSNPRGLQRVVVRRAPPVAAASGSAPGAPPSAPYSAAGPAGATVEVLTYARSLAAGETVRPEDVVWTEVQAHQARGGPRDAEAVIGLAARRALRAGAAVAARDLAAPQVIARNDLVQVAFVSGGVTLTVTGRATRDAAAGEPVPVLNLQSGRTIDAVAVGPGRAAAGPAARASALQFAAR